MKIRSLFCGIMFSGALTAPASILYAQQEPDQIALANDEFENSFYEALKQKGIENYDKALESLYKCQTKQPENAAVYNELGRNYLSLKRYPEAEKAFLKATQIDATNRWYWQGLYDVYYATQDFNKCIPIVIKLTEWRKQYYQEDLVSLYMYTHQYDKALALIDELDASVGVSDKREMYRLQILSDAKYAKPQKETLEEAIRKNPKDENSYLQLIYLYSESNQEAKAEEIAKRLEKELPDSDWAQVSLFKFHISHNDGAKASQSMFRILGGKKIDGKIKHRVLNEFLIFANNHPAYEKDLEKAIGYFDNDKDVNVNKEVGKFFFNNKNYTQALKYFTKSLGNKADDIEAIELLLLSYSESGDFTTLTTKASGYIDTYPTHARLYYYAGLGANRQKQFGKAKDWLESGLDFVVDNPELEAGFNRELGEAYKGLGDAKKSAAYFAKAEKLQKK